VAGVVVTLALSVIIALITGPVPVVYDSMFYCEFPALDLM
jgi:hypothetical protein